MNALRVMSPCSLPNATALPENETAPMISASRVASDAPNSMHAGVALPRELEDRDERRRAAAGAVEERHHLRHRGHLHHPRAGEAGDAADGDAGEDQRRRQPFTSAAKNVAMTAMSIPVAAMRLPLPRGGRRREPFRPRMNSDSRDQIGDRDEELSTVIPSSAARAAA